MPTYFLKFTGVVIAFVLTACGQVSQITPVAPSTPTMGIDGPRTFDLAEFESNRTKWLNAQIKDYSLEINASGYLRPFVPALITVRGSRLSSIKPRDPKMNQVLAEIYKEMNIATIDEVFVFVERNSKGKPEEFRITYDETYGFPDSLYLDHKLGTADDEIVLGIENFKINQDLRINQ